MSDPVNPNHYRIGGFEVADVLDAWGLDHHLASAVEYIARAGRKTPDLLTDLRKARWRVDRAISLLEKRARRGRRVRGRK